MFKTFMFGTLCSMACLAVMPTSASAQANTWVYWAGEQGAYQRGDTTVANPKRSIRFINIEYKGQNDFKAWKKSFFEAVTMYKKENITHALGGNNNFFEVGGLSNTVKRIVGWTDDKSGEYGFVVITHIENGTVYYVDWNGNSHSVRDTPGNFISWKIGYEPGDWGPGITYLVSIQLWKHKGTGSPNAACAFWFRQAGKI